MGLFTHKSMMVQAFRFGREEAPGWFRNAMEHGYIDLGIDNTLTIFPKTGRIITAVPGDYIIRHVVEGEAAYIWACQADLFAVLYELWEG